jgi:outer membrane protein
MAKEALTIAAEQLRVTQIGVSRLRKLNDAGAISPNELLSLEAQLARDEQRELTAKNNLILSKLLLSQGMGMKVDDFIISDFGAQDIDEQPSIIRIRPQAIYASSLNDQPNINAAKLLIQSADLGLKVAYASRLPRLTVNGQIATSYSDQARNIQSELQVLEFGYWLDGSGNSIPVYTEQNIPVGFETKTLQNQLKDNVRQYVGLNLTLPIFNGFQISNNIKRAEISKMNAELQYQQELDNYAQTIERSHADASSAWKQYLAAKKTLKAAKKAFEDASVRRQEGTLTVYDYSNVQNTYMAAASDVASAKYDAHFKAFILKFYMKSPLIKAKNIDENE